MKAVMAKQVLLVLAVSLFFYFAEVSSDFDIDEQIASVSKFGSSFINRRFLHEMGESIGSLDTAGFENGLSNSPTPAPALAPRGGGHVVLDCGGLCDQRCSAHSRQNVCRRACGTCCARCKCVPPGTFGNREVCGKCYTDMITHGNKTKCP